MKNTGLKDRFGNEIFIGNFLKIRKDVGDLTCKDCTVYEVRESVDGFKIISLYDFIDGDEILKHHELINMDAVEDFSEIIWEDQRELKGPKKIIYEESWGYGNMGESVVIEKLPKCPYCGAVPTYDINPCPFCGKLIDYSK